MNHAKVVRWRELVAITCAVWLVVPRLEAQAQGDGPPSRSTVARTLESDMVVTRHQMALNGKPLHYTARAGFLPIRNNDTGDEHARIFFVAYTVDRVPGAAPRPLTFVWNGGPGSNSTLVHLVGFGPRRISTGDDPAHAAASPPVIEDNQDTWLTTTDLVFVDPVGTGFSRPVKAEYASEFYSVLGDIAAIAEFVRVYRASFDAMSDPLFLAGESYGVWRAAGVAEALEQRGQKVSGVMLISGGIPVGPVASDAARTALFVPNRAATAFYHHKLDAELERDRARTMRDAEQWALDTYAPAWERRDQLSAAERARIASDLARFTGVGDSAIDRKTLAMTSPQFRSALLSDRKLTLGRYDMRLTGPSASPVDATLVSRYLRGELRFNTDLAYQGLEIGYTAAGSNTNSVGARWEWNQAPAGAPATNAGSGDGPPGGAQPWLRRAMLLDHDLQAFVAAGLYDSLNSCADNAYIIAHIESAFSHNISAGCYEGGHMMYDVTSVRRELARDVTAFIRRAAASPRR